MSDPRLPQLIAIHCPDCMRPGKDAAALRVPEALSFAVVPGATLRPRDVVHACGWCRHCGKEWCAITERRWRNETVAEAA